MVWRLTRQEFESGKGDMNRDRLRALVLDGREPGLIGFHSDRPVAWCAVAPRTEYSFLERSRVLKPVDDQDVWSISCLFVDRAYRRRGLSVAMLREAVSYAARRGAKMVEGYPVDPSKDRSPDAFIWTGIPSTFLKAGFSEVARRSPTRPIMRFAVSIER